MVLPPFFISWHRGIEPWNINIPFHQVPSGGWKQWFSVRPWHVRRILIVMITIIFLKWIGMVMTNPHNFIEWQSSFHFFFPREGIKASCLTHFPIQTSALETVPIYWRVVWSFGVPAARGVTREGNAKAGQSESQWEREGKDVEINCLFYNGQRLNQSGVEGCMVQKRLLSTFFLSFHCSTRS